MNVKVNKDELYKLSAIELYKMVLRKDIVRFPNGFWKRPESDQNAIEITKYFITYILEWDDVDIKEKWCSNILKKNSLGGMLSVVFFKSPYNIINLAYPNRFKPWEFKRVPMNYWTLETGIEAIRWLFEEKLEWSDDDIKRNLSCNVFIENGIGGMFYVVFKSIAFDAINSAYPGRFMPWQFKHTTNGYWTLESGIEATKWLVEKKLKWSDSDIKQKLSRNVFIENGLNGMLQICYGKSYKKAIRSAYPESDI
jgi:hypothetical protein